MKRNQIKAMKARQKGSVEGIGIVRADLPTLKKAKAFGRKQLQKGFKIKRDRDLDNEFVITGRFKTRGKFGNVGVT